MKRTQRKGARICLLLTIMLTVLLAGCARRDGDDAARQMVATVAAMPDGSRIDLAAVLAIQWERALLMEPYSTAEQMNEQLGFDGFSDGEWGPSDEANQKVAFIRGQSVVATVSLFPERDSFRFDPSITAFSRESAVFVVDRDDDHVVLTR